MASTQDFIAKFTSSPPAIEDSTIKQVSGNIGIKTTTVSASLHLAADDPGIPHQARILMLGEPGYPTYGYGLSTNSGDGLLRLYSYNNGTESTNPIIAINRSTGSVGIGTTAPAVRLHVAGDGNEEIRVESTGASSNATLRIKSATNQSSLIEMDDSGTPAGRVVYNHSVDSMGLYTAATERLRLDSAGGINLVGLKIKYVPIGTNTLSDAVAAMADGDCLVLGAGNYTQSVVITIPTSVTRFAIIGQGSAVSIVEYTANVDGIVSQTGSDSYRIKRAVLAGFSMAYSSGTANTKTGITLWGSSYEVYYKPGIVLYDLAMHYVHGSNDDCWTDCIRLIDCRVVAIDKVFIRREANGTSGTGILLESCLQTRITNSFIMCVEKGISLVKASNDLISGDIKHGCEDITFTTSSVYHVDKGANLGYKCLSAKINTVEFAGLTAHAIFEDVSSGAEAGGHHIIANVYVDPDTTNWVANASIMNIARPGTVIQGCHFHMNTQLAFNAIVFDGAADGDLCTASDNVILESGASGGSGIYITGNYCKATGNVFINSYTASGAGADITIGSGGAGNLADNNMLDHRITDNGTGSVIGTNPVH